MRVAPKDRLDAHAERRRRILSTRRRARARMQRNPRTMLLAAAGWETFPTESVWRNGRWHCGADAASMRA